MSFRCLLLPVFAVLLAFGCIPLGASAQGMTTGGITGVVTNPKNAVVVQATVTLRNIAKGTTQETETSGTGTYQFVLLDPGQYTVTVTAPGYQEASKEVTVPLGPPVMINFEMAVKSATPSRAPSRAPIVSVLEIKNADVATTLTERQISQIPNSGNDLTYLAQIVPGAVMNTQSGYGNFSMYGLPATSNRFTLDGMVDNEPFLNIDNTGATNLWLGSSEVQEVTVESNGYSGSFGEFAGANVNYITRSGGDNLHGTATYYWNGRQLNANSWLNNQAGNPRPFDNVNEWAASVGGPLKRDKLFFFMDTEGLHVLLPTSQQVSIPSPQFEGSTILNLETNFPNSVVFYCQNITVTPPNNVPITCPASAGYTTYPSNVHIGGGIFNLYNTAPNAVNATDSLPSSSFPDPNNPGNTIYTGDGCGSFTQDPNFGVSQPSTLAAPTGLLPCALSFVANNRNYASEWNIAARLDYIIGPRDRAFLRIRTDHGSQATYTDPLNSAFNAKTSLPEYEGQLQESHSIGGTGVNQFLLAVRWSSAFTNVASPSSALFAFPGQLSFADHALADVGGGLSNWPRGRNSTQFQLSDDFSRTFGSTTLKFGGTFRRLNVSDHDYGRYTAPFLQVNSLNDFYNGGSTGDVFTQAFPTSLDQPIAYYTAGAYLEDDWRESSTLSFTLSLRAEHDSNPICRSLCFARLQSPFTLFQGVSNGQFLGDVPYNQAILDKEEHAFPSIQSLLFDPRIGFAWQPLGTKNPTVIRAGIGIYHDLYPAIVVDSLSSNPPLLNTFTIHQNNLAPTEVSNVFLSASQANAAFVSGFANGQTVSQITTAPLIPSGIATFFQPALTVTEAKVRPAEYAKVSLEIEHQMGPNTVIRITGVGSHGSHVPVTNASANAYGFFTSLPAGTYPPAGETYPTGDTTTFPTGQCSGTTTPCTGIDPRFSQVTVLSGGGTSKYYGVTASFTHRFESFGRGLVQVNYTFGHAYDTISNGGFLPFNGGESPSLMSPQDPYNLSGSYAPADYDVRHYVSANYVWEIPFRKLMPKKGSSRLLKGWELAGTVFFRTGLPYSVTDGQFSNALSQFNYFSSILPAPISAVPVSSCGRSAAGTKGVPCLPIASFPTSGTETAFSTGMRNYFRGPKYFNTDISLMKNTAFPGWEGAQLGIGVQVFNLFNHPNFDMPVSDISSPLFGTIGRMVNEPTSILGSFPGSTSSARVMQVKAQISF